MMYNHSFLFIYEAFVTLIFIVVVAVVIINTNTHILMILHLCPVAHTRIPRALRSATVVEGATGMNKSNREKNTVFFYQVAFEMYYDFYSYMRHLLL